MLHQNWTLISKKDALGTIISLHVVYLFHAGSPKARGPGQRLKAKSPNSALASFNQSNPVKRKLDHLTPLFMASWSSCVFWSRNWILTMTMWSGLCFLSDFISCHLLHALGIALNAMPQFYQAYIHLGLCMWHSNYMALSQVTAWPPLPLKPLSNVTFLVRLSLFIWL